MELELEGGNAVAVGLITLLIVLLFLGLAGRLVTPVFRGEAQLLTPDRWAAYKLQKQARRETEKLVRDAKRLQRILDNSTPDPVEAMLLAQDIYANHQTGSSSTIAARSALITAAETTVQTTIGGISRDDAIADFNEAASRIDALSTAQQAFSSRTFPPTTPSVQYLPSIQAP